MRARWVYYYTFTIALIFGGCLDIASTTEENEWVTDHQRHLKETHVDFSQIDLNGSPTDAAWKAVTELTLDLQQRITTLFEKTKTPECRALIAEHFGYFMKAIATETPLPFTHVKFNNTCQGIEEYDFDNLPEGVHMGIIQNLTYQPPRNETEYIEPSDVVLCYGILAHDDPISTIRLIEAVDEPTTTFVIHVDGKYEDTYLVLKEYASHHSKVKVLDHPYRVRVNWGGFSMVNATLQILNYADKIDFTHFIHMASSAYPIASNQRIRNTLADYPKDANFLHVILRPTVPHPKVWNYFVECDDRVHRIYELPPLRKAVHGVDLYTASQWFIISKEFAHYLANPTAGSFLHQYLEYMPHALVADEHFFGTVLRSTPFCHKHHNWNYLHLQFDQWENERNVEMRDERKCVMPDPNHCGRSPTTITLDYIDILELSGDLFARKFSNNVEPRAKDIIDELRVKEEFELKSLNITKPRSYSGNDYLTLEGHGTLIVAKETANSDDPLCLGLGEERNKVRLVPCFQDGVPETLADDWETGAVVLEETIPHNRWKIGPCSSDGHLKKMDSGDVEVTSGTYNPTGPRCTITMMDGLRTGRCLSGESQDPQPGGPVHVFPCMQRWYQYLSFGNGKDTPAGSIHTTIPSHTRRRIEETGREQEAYMCLGVRGRGKLDEEDWFGKRGYQDESESDSEDSEESESNSEEDSENNVADRIDKDSFSVDGDELQNSEDGLDDLSDWEGSQLIATRCSNIGAVIEWILVPFIEDDDDTKVVYKNSDGPGETKHPNDDSASDDREDL